MQVITIFKMKPSEGEATWIDPIVRPALQDRVFHPKKWVEEVGDLHDDPPRRKTMSMVTVSLIFLQEQPDSAPTRRWTGAGTR
jgi:hypothetical protein